MINGDILDQVETHGSCVLFDPLLLFH